MISANLTRKYYCSLSEDIPLCVIEEIVKETGKFVEHDSLDHLLELYDEISVDRGEYDVEKVARFLNPELDPKQWRWESLTRAATFFIECASHPEMIPINFETGFQTNQKPHRVNLFMLYLLCCTLGLPTNFETTPEELERLVKLHRSTDYQLGRQITRTLKLIGRSHIVATLASNKIALPEDDFTTWDYDLNHYPYHNFVLDDAKFEVFLGQLARSTEPIEPENNIAAVILGAVRYHLDLSYCKDPLLEYFLLENHGIEAYIPDDSWCKFWYQKNPRLFDVRQTYNPWFPKSFYLYNHFGENILANETCEITKETIHSTLRELSQTDNIQVGLVPGLLGEKSAIYLEDLSTTNDEVLSISIWRNGTCKNYGITKQEFHDYLLCRNDFVSPFDSNVVLHPRIIHKYCQMMDDPQLTIQVERIYALINSSTAALEKLAHHYQHAEEEVRNQVSLATSTLLDLAMYMRGWNGIDEYPISLAITPTEFFEQLLCNVTDTIQKLETICCTIPHELNILHLPLVCYRDKNYVMSTNELDGITIKERLDIVKGGENIDNEASCIRITSNWFASSSIRIMEQLGIKPPFHIGDLRYVL